MRIIHCRPSFHHGASASSTAAPAPQASAKRSTQAPLRSEGVCLQHLGDVVTPRQGRAGHHAGGPRHPIRTGALQSVTGFELNARVVQ